MASFRYQDVPTGDMLVLSPTFALDLLQGRNVSDCGTWDELGLSR